MLQCHSVYLAKEEGLSRLHFQASTKCPELRQRSTKLENLVLRCHTSYSSCAGNTWLTFNYERGMLEKSRTLSVKLRRGFKDEVRRINWDDLGHKDELSASSLICGARLTPTPPPPHTHTHTPTQHLIRQQRSQVCR